VAEVVADALGGVVVASDRVRKRLAGLEPTARAAAGWAGGIYTPERTREVYAGLLERAGPILESGRAAILDATYARATQRAEALALARARGVPALLVEAQCATELARERLARRQREGRDPSDAGPELLARSAAAFEAPEEWPAARRCALRTDTGDWMPEAARRIRTLAAEAMEEGR
jgi:hypothetical protein